MQKVKQKRFLIVNGYHDVWHYVPMGSFGICDYLAKKGIQSRIFNAAIYNKSSYLEKLNKIIRQFRPTHIGLVLHWKELLENAIYLSAAIKKRHPHITIVAGGITAGYLQKELLNKCPSIDYVIKGDAELPLLKLISGSDTRRIPNLAYRENGGVAINGCSYHISAKALDDVSFSNLKYLYDYEKYLKIIDNMGFPVFIGRGCIYNCLYCGGSRRASLIHSDRKRVVKRSVGAIIKDLRRLLKYTNDIYFDYEADVSHIRKLFKKILEDKMLRGKYKISYGTWSLMDPELIDLYSKICRFDQKEKPVIEISPESAIEKVRESVRDRALCFKNGEMLQNIDDILKATGNGVILNVYCSRYHRMHKGMSELLAELRGIHSFREYFYKTGSCDNVVIHSSHLATDVASVYWDLANKNRACDDPIELLIKTHRRFCAHKAGEFELDNMCIYHPASLGDGQIFRYEQLIKWVDLLHDAAPHYYFTITKSAGMNNVIEILTDIVREYCGANKWDKFDRTTARSLISAIHGGIRRKFARIYNSNRAYFDGLESIFLKYCNALGREERGAPPKMRGVRGLDPSRYCITEYDYFADGFYDKLECGLANVEKKKTINLISKGYVHTMDYKFYPALKSYRGKNMIETFLRRYDREYMV